MRTWFFLGFSLAILFGASEASAAPLCKIGTAPVCADVRLTRLYLDPNGMYVETDADELGLSGTSTLACNPESGVYLWLDRNNPNYQAIVSSLLSAKLANSAMTIRLVKSMGEGLNLRCTISWVLIS